MLPEKARTLTGSTPNLETNEVKDSEAMQPQN
uniref:Uncharacterized protein n=1 Tax=Anopheles atroparvus TaxID=41427 RepID=A0AAG5D6M0_ANOAO